MARDTSCFFYYLNDSLTYVFMCLCIHTFRFYSTTTYTIHGFENMPETQFQPQPQFTDFYLGEIGVREIVKYGSKSLHVFSDTGKFIFKNSALTQLAHHLGFKRRELREVDVEDIARAMREKGSLVLSVVEIEPNVYFVFRVTSEEYTPVPHRVLFDFAKNIIDEADLETEMVVRRYAKRTVAYFYLHRIPLNYARQGDALSVILAVSNANTGRHSIKVYGYFEILACRNGLIHNDFVERIRISHVGRIEDILKRVGGAVKRVLGLLLINGEEVKAKIEKLEEIEVPEWKINLWLQLQQQKLPKSYRPWFYRVLQDNRRTFGDTAESMYQTLTFLAPRIMGRNEDLAQRLNNEAYKLLVAPIQYIEKIKR